jgi:uncharacterized protein
MAMKYLLVLVVVLVAIGLWRQNRRQNRHDDRHPDRPQQPTARAPSAPPTDMVACAHCGVHLPRTEAINGAAGAAYCCDAHRKAREG